MVKGRALARVKEEKVTELIYIKMDGARGYDLFWGSSKLRGPGLGGIDSLRVSLGTVGSPSKQGFVLHFKVSCNREGSQQCPATHGGSQFRPSPGPWPLNFKEPQTKSWSVLWFKNHQNFQKSIFVH